MKIANRRELQQIALLSEIDFEDFIKIYKKCTAEPCPFSVSDATLESDNPLMLCHQINLISMNILQAKKYYHQIKNK